MKRWILIGLAGLFLSGCAAATRSEFMQNDAQFKNWDHMKFSLWGYRNTSDQEAKKSQEQGWWGAEVPYIPAQ